MFTLGYTNLGNGGFNPNIKASNPFYDTFDNYVNLSRENKLEECDAIVLWGGEDIHPSFYKQKAHHKNQADGYYPSTRDLLEWHLMRMAYEEKIPIIGVCRGAQILCCFAGGSLYQHVTGHEAGHELETYDDLTFNRVAANHHQMMNLDNTKYELLAWCDMKSQLYEGEEKGVDKRGDHLQALEGDPEVVYFPDVLGLACQPHPEWEAQDSAFNKWLNNEIVKRFR